MSDTPHNLNDELPDDEPLEETPGQPGPVDDGSETDAEVTERPELDLKQPKVNLRGGGAYENPAPDDLPLSAFVALIRESHRNTRQIIDANSAHFDRLDQLEMAMAEALAEKGKTVGDEDGNPWFRVLMDSLTLARLDDVGLKASEREGSDWGPVVEHKGKALRGGQPRQSLGAGTHSPDELLSYMAKRAGVGTTFEYPLWHSGIWLRFRSPSLTEIVTMQHELAQKKVKLGTDTKGMAFSNTAQVMNSLAVNFALNFVIDSNLPFKTPTDLEAHIDALDGPVVLLGLASTMYPGGLPYASPCVSDVHDCQHIMKALLNMHLLWQVDTSVLSQMQLNHMNRRFNRTTVEEIVKYKAEHRNGREKVVWFNNIGLRLGSPTLMQQREAGDAWIDNIVEMTQGAFNEPPHGSNRNAYISRLGRTTTARQYAHFVTAVLDSDEGAAEGYRVISEDLGVINKFLDNVMSTSDYVDPFFKEVQDFIEESLVAQVAIPSYNCQACKTPAAEKFHERFEHLVPLDMLSLFFMLASRKLS